MKKFFIFLIASISFGAFAFSSNLEKLVTEIGEITGKNYVYTIKLEGGVKATENIKFEKENADKFLSWLLFQNNYTRIPMPGNMYTIIDSHDIRYNVLPEVEANATLTPDLPDTYDYQNMVYTMKSSLLTSYVTAALRPLMSRYGRVLEQQEAKKLIIQDTAINLKRIYKIIKDSDVEPSKAMIKVIEKKNKEKEELRRIEAKSCKDYIAQIEELKACKKD